MSLKTHRDALHAIVASVVAVGIVHKYERWAADQKRFLELFRDPTTQTIRGATLTREGTPEPPETNSQTESQYRWVIRLYMAINDTEASELTFQDDVVEGVRNALRADVNLGGITESDCEPPVVRVCEPRMFSGVLCHYAEITTTSYELQEVGRG